jgi:hypothetical protein
MPNRERSAKERVQTATFHPTRDFTIAKPKPAKLHPRHNPMLLPCQPSNRVIQASGAPFGLHGCIRRTGGGLAPRLGAAA